MSKLDDWAEDHRKRVAAQSRRVAWLKAMHWAIQSGSISFPAFMEARPYVPVGDSAIATALALGAADGSEGQAQVHDAKPGERAQ